MNTTAQILQQKNNRPWNIITHHTVENLCLDNLIWSDVIDRRNYIYFEAFNIFVKILSTKPNYRMRRHQYRSKEYSDNLDKVKLALKSIN